MKYSYEQERDYIRKYQFGSYLDLAPPPCNMGNSRYKLWRLHDIQTFLHWYGKNCEYVVHDVSINNNALDSFPMPTFFHDYINFVKIGPYSYLMTNYDRVN